MDRLLTNPEIKKAVDDWVDSGEEHGFLHAIKQAQDAKTAKIVRNETIKEVKAWFMALGLHVQSNKHWDSLVSPKIKINMFPIVYPNQDGQMFFPKEIE